MKELKELGWSEDNIAKAIGVTRPKYKKYLQGDNKLTIEEQAKLDVLKEMQEPFRVAQSVALGRYIFDEVWRRSYRRLSKDTK